MLGNLFNKPPQWLHADPAERKRAIELLEPNAAELFTLSLDRDPQVRSAALAKITDIERLTDLLPDASHAPEIRERLLVLLSTAPADVCDQGLAKLGGEEEMVKIASSAPTHALRMQAAQRVHSIPLLERLESEARAKDQGVAKYAKERLMAIQTQAGREAAASQICSALEALVQTEGPVTSAVVELDRQYAALQPDAPYAERYAAARSLLSVRFEREQELQRERNAWMRSFDELKRIEQSGEMSHATLELARRQYEMLEAKAQQFPDLLDRLHQSGARHAIELLERTLEAQAQADALLHDFAPAVDSAARLIEFEDRWNQLPAEGRDPVRQQRFDDLLQGHRRQLAAKETADAARQAEHRHKLHTLLAQAEELLAAGEIQKAAQIRDEMKPLRALCGELPKPTNQRLGRLSQQLGDLLRWQAFGNATQREEMCAQVESLPSLGLPVVELAKRVQALRDQWKQLDQTQAPAPRALWERFNAACEVAYAPAAEYFAKQAEQRREALARREAAIKELSDYATLALTPNPDQPNWAPDWKAIAVHLNKVDAQWRTLGQVDRKKIDSIEKKWAAAGQPLRDGLKAVYSEETAQRQALIANVKSLIQADGKLVAGAVGKVKEAQVAWQTRAKSLPLPRKLEQDLWETFRAACNAVFDALAAEKAARHAAFASAVAERTALIDQYAALAQSSDEKAIRAAIIEAPKQWARLGDPGRENERKLADRFDKVLRGLRDALSAKERARGQLQIESLFAVAHALAASETAVLSGSVPAAHLPSECVERYESLPPAWKQALAPRKAAVEKAANGNGIEELRQRIAQSQAQLESLLSDLESEFGVESPHLSAQQRMQMQVARLANRMKTRTATPPLERFVQLCALPSGSADATYMRIRALVPLIVAHSSSRHANSPPRR